MSEELPKPNWDRNRKQLREEVNNGIPIRPVDVEEIEIGNNRIEVVRNGDRLVFHFYKKHGASFPMSFRGRLYSALTAHLNLRGNEEQLVITYEQELSSWCALIKDVNVVVPPSDETIVEMLTQAVS